MKRILGLDLGIASVGWALVNEAENETEKSSIEKLGVRIVNYESFVKSKDGKELKGNPADFFGKGVGISPNALRRQKRSMRRNLQRYKLRRAELINIMRNAGLISDNDILSENGDMTTYETLQIRAKAATEKVTLCELARVLLMINKKRGYKSNRKAKDGEEGNLIDGMEVAMKLCNEHITPGEFGYELLKSGKKYLPDFYPSDLRAELHKIWDFQMNEFYPEILTKEVRDKIEGKNKNQTWAILAQNWSWIEPHQMWNDAESRHETLAVECRLEGISRTTKGEELKIENYLWRAKALKEKMPLEQLAMVFQEINDDISRSSGYLGAISDRSKELNFKKQTVGQYLWQLIEENPHVSLKNRVFYRKDYLDEFNTIWETQAKYHKELTSELKREIRDVTIFYQRRLKSQKSLVSYCEFESEEREVKKKDGTKKKVQMGSKVIPHSSPLFQEFRIWQQINNIQVSIRDEQGKVVKRFLNQDEKEKLAKELYLKVKMEKSAIISLLFDKSADVDINFKKVDGNTTARTLFQAYSTISEMSGHGVIKFNSADAVISQVQAVFTHLGISTDYLIFDSSNLGGKRIFEDPFYKLWHLLYSFEGDNSVVGNKKLIEKLKTLLNINEDYAKVMASVNFKADYGNLSAKAIRKILPYMKQGDRYDEACKKANYRHSKSSLTKEELAGRETSSALSLIPKNKLKNPLVEKILNQMANVVNAIISEYGKPDEIRVELARELKNCAEKRKQISEGLDKATKRNDEIKEILKKEFFIAHPSKNDIIRYKLYQELKDNGYKTLYSVDGNSRYISRDNLFSKDVDIEHVIPKARLFDDSLSNKTLEFKSVNIEKGKSTAYDYIKEKHSDKLQEYIKTCENLFKGKNNAKLNNLLMSADDIPVGFIERDLKTTQYISRKALSMLSQLCNRVVVTTGSITDRLRQDWQLVDVMKELNMSKYDELGLVYSYQNRDGNTIKRIQDWNKRNDHRHHAMDALAVAFTKGVFVQYFNNINACHNDNSQEYAIKQKYFVRNGRGKLIATPPIPLDQFRGQTIEKMKELLISVKSNKKVTTSNVTNNVKKEEQEDSNGKKSEIKVQQTPRMQLHNDTFYGRMSYYNTKVDKVGASFDAEKIALVAKKSYREALLARLNEFGGDAKKAFTGKNSITNNPIWIDEMHLHAVPEKVKLVYVEHRFIERKDITKDLKIENVVDARIKGILQQRLNEFNGNASEAFSNLDENPIWFNKEKGICIKRVKLVKSIKDPVGLHYKIDKDGKPLLDCDQNPIPIDFVATNGNHHIAIYKKPVLDKYGNQKEDKCGNLLYAIDEKVVTKYEAVVRRNENIPVIDKEYRRSEGWEFLYSMHRNEYFVFPNDETGFNPHEVGLTDPENYAMISPNLYKVEALSSKYYEFRHHLDTSKDTKKELQNITWKRITGISFMDKIVKVRINHIGQIVAVGEE